MKTKAKLAILAALCGLLAPACTAVTGGTDAFEEAGEPHRCGTDGTRADADIELLGMNAHSTNLVISDLVRIEGVGPARVRRLVARAVYDPLVEADLSVVIPCSVVPGNHEVDLWADLLANRMYDRSPADHQWRLMLQANGQLSYRHDVDFEDIADQAPMPRAALPFRPVFENMESFEGFRMRIEVRRVTDTRSDEVVLVYDMAEISQDRLTEMVDNPPFFFEGLIELRQRYEVAIWIDTNDDGLYERPSSSIGNRDYATVIADGLGEPPDLMMGVRGGLLVNVDGLSLPAAEDVEFPLVP